MARISKKIRAEFQDYIKQYEKDNGVQTIDVIRNLTRAFAGSKSHLNDKAAQPIYWTLFATICYERTNVFPDDFNWDNPYDPDGLYPDDKSIKRKLRRDENQVQKRVLDLINPPR